MTTDPRLIISGLPLEHPHVGQGVYTSRLLSGLHRRLGDQTVVVVRDNGDVIAAKYGVTVATLPRRPLPPHDFIKHVVTSTRLVDFVANNFPRSIFHSPGPIVGGRKPQRTIVTIHDCIYRSFPNYLGRFFIRKLYMRATERFARNSSLVLTDSEFSKQELIAKIGIRAENIDVLYPWVGPEFLREISQDEITKVQQRYRLPQKFWLYVGGYDYRKNVEMLIHAYALASASAELPPLVLAGYIPTQRSRVVCDMLSTIKASSLQADQILMPGPISSEDLPIIYKAASLFIYPSLMEGFGLPPAEAIAVGTPVLASNTSSVPEVVPKAACLFDPRDVDDLKSKLLAAASDERQFVTHLRVEFTEDFAITRYLKLLDRMAPAANG